MNIDLILNLTKQKKIDVDLSFRMVTKATKLLKKISVAMKLESGELTKLFNQDGASFFSRLNDFIADEYDEVNDSYGALSLELFNLIKAITKSNEAIEDLQIIEIFEKINDIANKIRGEGQDDFLGGSDTTPANITEPSSITEGES
jgi:hypothetical protein